MELNRVRIMHVGLKGLPVGEWRDLTPKELAVLLDAVKDSKSEASPGARKPQRASKGKLQKPRAYKSREGNSKPSTSRKPPKKGKSSKTDKSSRAEKNAKFAKSSKPASGRRQTQKKTSNKNGANRSTRRR